MELGIRSNCEVTVSGACSVQVAMEGFCAIEWTKLRPSFNASQQEFT